MKTFQFRIFLFLLINNVYAQDILQDTVKLIIVSPKVGEIIDRSEKERYRMMSSIQNFVSASFYISSSGKFYSRIESIDDSGKAIIGIQEYPEAVLFRLAEKINNYEDIIDRNYLIGQEPVTVQVVGGEPVTWEPTWPKKNRKKQIKITNLRLMSLKTLIPSLQVHIIDLKYNSRMGTVSEKVHPHQAATTK